MTLYIKFSLRLIHAQLGIKQSPCIFDQYWTQCWTKCHGTIYAFHLLVSRGSSDDTILSLNFYVQAWWEPARSRDKLRYDKRMEGSS